MHAEITSPARQISPEVHLLVATQARRLWFAVDSGDPGLVHCLEAAGMAAWRATAGEATLSMNPDVRMLLAQRVRASMLDFLRERPHTPGPNYRSDS